MRIEAIVIGDELLRGDLADRNAVRLGALLRDRGLALSGVQTVPDELPAIEDALRASCGRSELVVVTGGLGPTEDDRTVDALARYLGVPLHEDPVVLERLRQRFEARGVPFTANNARQARVPEGAEVLANPVGTAPGIRAEAGGTTLFALPGVPREVERMVADHLLPWLDRHAESRPMHTRVLKTFGRTESKVATALEDLPRDGRLSVGYRAHFPEIHVILRVDEPDPDAATRLLEQARDGVRERLGAGIFTEDPEETLPAVVGRLATGQGRTVAAAESCTGGLLSAHATAISGASAWFVEGAVTYTNAAKIRRLGVPEATLEAHGAVSEATARAMAEGIRHAAGADHGLAITGVAGPSGGTADKPVGTVHLAVASAEGTTHRHRRLPFERERNRLASVWGTLDLLRRELLGVDT